MSLCAYCEVRYKVASKSTYTMTYRIVHWLFIRLCGISYAMNNLIYAVFSSV